MTEELRHQVNRVNFWLDLFLRSKKCADSEGMALQEELRETLERHLRTLEEMARQEWGTLSQVERDDIAVTRVLAEIALLQDEEEVVK